MALATRSDGDREVFFNYMEALKLPVGWRVEDAEKAVEGKVRVTTILTTPQQAKQATK
jgi:hypothetical protein